ncbi:MAG: hypothetical protein JXR07_10400 [Reichenbachiella sp.]
MIGPPYLDVSRRYSNQPDEKKRIAEKIKKGGGGLWYGGQMTPHVFLSKTELDTLTTWVLGMEHLRNNYFEKIANESIEKVLLDKSGNGFQLELIDNPQNVSDFLKVDFSESMMGHVKTINFFGTSQFETVKKNSILKFEGKVEVLADGKYFLRLLKTGIGQLYIDGNSIISKRMDDHELAIDLKTGVHDFKVFYKPKFKNDTLSLSWISPGSTYYETITTIEN